MIDFLFVHPEVTCLVMFLTTLALLMAGFPVAFTLAGVGLVFAFLGELAGVFDTAFLTAFPQRIFATMTNETLVAVPLFVFMGVMLERSKVAEELLDNMGRLFGSKPGGLAFSVCIVGALLAASTGIVGATVVTMGLLSLPTMLRRGYSKRLATGSIAASGTLGQIIPPSIVLVLLGDQLSSAYQEAQFEQGIFAPDTVSVNDLFAGALFPGLMLVGLYMLYQLAFVLFKPEGAPAIEDESGMDRGEVVKTVLKALFAPIALIIAVLGSILGGLATPTEAAGVGAIGATMLAGYRANEAKGGIIIAGVVALIAILVLTAFVDLRAQRSVVEAYEWIAIVAAGILTVVVAISVVAALVRTFRVIGDDGERVLASVCRSTMLISSMVFIIIIGAAMFSLVFRGFGGDEYIEHFLENLPGGTITAMLLVMVVMFLMGFFLDFLEIVFIVVPLVAPVLLQLDMPGNPGVLMSPVWLGVMMAINLQTSFLTPPFGFALFYLRGVAPPEVRTSDIYYGIIPFVMIQLFALVLIWFLPGIATWLPNAVYG